MPEHGPAGKSGERASKARQSLPLDRRSSSPGPPVNTDFFSVDKLMLCVFF